MTVGRRGDGTKPHHGRQAPGVSGKPTNGSREPHGTDFNRADGPPDKSFSLYAHYKWRLDRATAEATRANKAGDHAEWVKAILRLDKLCSFALVDLLLYTGEVKRPASDTNAANVRRLLADYRGVPAHEVAVCEMCEVAWVRRSRRAEGVDPEYGEERTQDERLLKAIRLKAAGATQGAIAAELGVNQGTVSRWLAA